MDSNVKNESECKVFKRKYRPEMKTAFEMRKSRFADNCADIKEWMDWTLDISLMNERQFKRVKSIYAFAMYVYPNCADSTRCETMCKYMMMSAVWDDHSEESGGDVGRDVKRGLDLWQQYESALDYVHGKGSVPINKWKPYTYAFYSLFVTICDTFNEEQKRRFFGLWKDFMIGSIEECHLFEGEIKMTTVDEIMAIRRKSGAIMGYMQLLEYSDDICLTDEEWYDPQMQTMLTLAADYVIYINDLWSFEKEFVERGSREEELLHISNSVAIIAGLKQCSIAEAMDAVIERHGEVEEKVFALMEAIRHRPGIRDEVKVYLKTLECFLGGNLKASQALDRYNKIE